MARSGDQKKPRPAWGRSKNARWYHPDCAQMARQTGHERPLSEMQSHLRPDNGERHRFAYWFLSRRSAFSSGGIFSEGSRVSFTYHTLSVSTLDRLLVSISNSTIYVFRKLFQAVLLFHCTRKTRILEVEKFLTTHVSYVILECMTIMINLDNDFKDKDGALWLSLMRDLLRR